MGRLFYNTTRLSKEELQKIHIFIYYRCNFKNLLFKIMLVVCMFFISVDYVMNNEHGKSIILIYGIILYEVIFKPFLSSPRMEQTVRLEAYENYIILSDLKDKKIVYYEEISNIIENKNFYFIIINKFCVPIKKDSFANSDNSEFKDFIFEKI